ncbi:MAG: HAD family hydrolase [Candidatus Methylacidiphilales bacterium]|nr:HAD hydrolase family protein [Candidatus Methylacidiphilales bacterium]
MPPSKSPVRFISTDYDGTFSRPGSSEIYESHFFDRLREWNKHERVYWAVNTGRNLLSVESELRHRGAPYMPDFLITIEREVYQRQGASFSMGLYKPWGDWNQVCSDRHAKLYATTEQLWVDARRWLREHTHANVMVDPGSPIGMIARDEEEAARIVQYMTELLEGYPGVKLVHNSIYFRFSHEDYNKGTAMHAVANSLGIPVDQVFAAGDHSNDIPMLNTRYAGHLACPGNATAEVKHLVLSQGGYLATAHNGEGTLEALEYIFTGKDVRHPEDGTVVDSAEEERVYQSQIRSIAQESFPEERESDAALKAER